MTTKQSGLPTILQLYLERAMLLSIKGQIKLRTKENHEKNKQKEERKKKRHYSVKSLLGDEVTGFNKLNATKVE